MSLRIARGVGRYVVMLALVIGAMLVLVRLSRQEASREGQPLTVQLDGGGAAPQPVGGAASDTAARDGASGVGARASADAPATPEQSAALERLIRAYESALAASLVGESSEPAAGAEAPVPGARTTYPSSADGIRVAMRAAKPQLEECFAPWLALNPTLGGRIAVTFRIAAGEGREAEIREVSLARGGLGNRFLEGCVLAVVGELSFEPPAGGDMVVTYPLAFE